MKIKIFLLSSVFLIFLAFQVSSFLVKDKTYFVFCNVGEGDGAVLIHRQTVFLIDAGRDFRARKCLERYLPFWQTQITGVILTHPDSDHISGLKSVIKRYRVKWLFSNFLPNKKGEYREIYDALVDSGAIVKPFVAGEKIDVKFSISNFQFLWNKTQKSENLINHILIYSLWPKEIHKESEKTNLFSNVSVVEIGESKFLMLADSEIETQLGLLKLIRNVKLGNLGNGREILEGYQAVKVSHHGSTKNFSLTLFRELLPQYAIISVGKNKYGHPGKKVLSELEKLKIQILQTDKQGDVVFECEKTCELVK